MLVDMKRKKIKELLLKAAKGYLVNEVTVEYSEVNGQMKVTKRKEIKKEVPGDLKALQMLIESENMGSGGFANWSDEELDKEKERLLKQLKMGDENGKIASGSKGSCRAKKNSSPDEGN